MLNYFIKVFEMMMSVYNLLVVKTTFTLSQIRENRFYMLNFIFIVNSTPDVYNVYKGTS